MRTALVVHPHPDDEVFATGAATIALADAGWRVVLHVATGGEAAESRALGEVDARTLRTAKLGRSCELLGIAEWGWLSEPGRWVDRGGVGPGTLAAAGSRVVADAVRQVLTVLQPQLVVTVGVDGLTGHPDHVAVGAAVREAAAGEFDVLGARLRAVDVAAARAELERLVAQADRSRPGKPRTVGSGRVVGVASGVELEEVRAAQDDVRRASAVLRRQQALDVYQAGLGTLPLEQVVEASERLGDSVLLRAILDRGRWDRDLFARTPAVRATSVEGQ
ncbi:PIG-L deacetylase family protein [Kribbella sp. CA-294648]|uniref:PIG-L deacetylase family protein n=1 Tax=Kribbella sp. CA-294648 TaxID=3239948 RepID=UPI003D930D48